MSPILMTTVFYKAVILQGEIWCWSVLGRKGLGRWSFHEERLQLALTGKTLGVLFRWLHMEVQLKLYYSSETIQEQKMFFC